MSLLRATCVFGLALMALPALAQEAAPPASTAAPTPPARASVATDGTVTVPRFVAPFSSLASEEAKRLFIESNSPAFYASPIARMGNLPITEQRVILDKHYLMPRIEKAKARYPVSIRPSTIGGVYVETITPAEGVPAKNAKRVLINLHGGGFVMGARTNGQLESIPIAGLGKYKVVAVDYRQGPEHRFPAASEDIATVYRELLKTYSAQNIGIFGCSAGGMLAAQAVAWFQKEGLPRPGAIGIFCASAGRMGDGDSRYMAPALNARPVPPPPSGNELARTLGYFAGADMTSPLVSPVLSEGVLAKFPPTLLINSTRDSSLSAALDTHRRLVNAKVEADLHVWDGLQHFFFADIELPESQEAFQVTVDFFDKHLGRR